MLYIFFGTDVDTVHKKSQALVASLLKRKPDASFYKLEPDAITGAVLDELTLSQGLFEQNFIVELNQSLEDSATKEEVMSKLEYMKKSSNVFIMVEHALKAPIKKKLEKFADKIQEDSQKKEGRNFMLDTGGTISLNTFNIFALADALGDKNKKELWILLQKAYFHNISAEEIHGTLMWQTRVMLIAKQTASVEESKLKPFVYNKAKRFSGKYTLEELRKLSSNLISMYHNVRKGGMELADALEIMILSGK